MKKNELFHYQIFETRPLPAFYNLPFALNFIVKLWGIVFHIYWLSRPGIYFEWIEIFWTGLTYTFVNCTIVFVLTYCIK